VTDPTLHFVEGGALRGRRQEELMEERSMKKAIRGESARSPEETNVRASPVGPRTSEIEAARTDAEGDRREGSA
jgi:hypothetical protein